MKKRVLFLVNHDLVIYNFRKELVEKLIEKNYEVIISSPEGKRLDYFRKLGCKVKVLKLNRKSKNPITDLKLLLNYIKLIRFERPNVVLTYTIKPNIYGGLASAFCKIPYISNITGLGMAVENDGVLQKITLSLYKLAFSRINKVFFQNEENQKLFNENNIASDRAVLIPGSGVNLNEYRLMDYPDGKIINFAFISRIMKEKGIEEYLDMAKYIKSKYPNTMFHVCGFCEDKYEEELEALQKEGIIKYHGMVDDIREILTKVHCVVHPSFYPEGISNILLEAAAIGRPIITTNRSGCKEVISNYQTGYLIDIKNKKQLIDKVEEFLLLDSNSKKTMGLLGREKVEKEFSREIVVENYLKSINEICYQRG